MSKKVKQSDIAKQAGVSQSMVSKILKGTAPANVSAAKIQAVMSSAIKLGYEPPKKSQMPAFEKARQATTKGPSATSPVALPPNKTDEKQLTVLDTLAKNAKKQLKALNKGNKIQTTNRKMWGMMAAGAAGVGIPLSIAGLFSKISNLVGQGSQATLDAGVLGVDADKLLGMQQTAESLGVPGRSITKSMTSLSTAMYKQRRGENAALSVAAGKAHLNAAAFEGSIASGDEVGFIKEALKQYQSGSVDKDSMTAFLNQTGLGAWAGLFASGEAGKVLDASASKGTAQAARDVDVALGELSKEINDVFMKTLPAIAPALDDLVADFSKWVSGITADDVESTVNQVIDGLKIFVEGLEKVAGYLGIDTNKSLLEKRNEILDRQKKGYGFGNYASIQQSNDLNELKKLNDALEARGFDANSLNGSAKQTADSAKTIKANDQSIAMTPKITQNKHEIDIKFSGDAGAATPELVEAITNTINNYMKSHYENVKESY